MGSYISKGVGGVMEKNLDIMKEQQQTMVIKHETDLFKYT